MSSLIYPEESYAIMGACFTVHNAKGCGFTEPIYQECLEIEFRYLGNPFVAQPELTLTYRDETLYHTFKPDFICYDKIIVEIKAVSQLIDDHRAQVLNYLNETEYKLGMLVNFAAHPKLTSERVPFTPKRVANE